MLAASTVLLLLCACASTPVAPVGNPFFTESELPYGLPPFDRIRDEHYLPAFERGMAEHAAEVDAIANNPDPPTFENTVVAMQRSGRVLARVNRMFKNMSSVNNTETLRELDVAISPKKSAHWGAVRLNAKLFERFEDLYQKRNELGLGAESQRLLEREYRRFIRRGIRLNDVEKARVREINAELSELTTRFKQNLQADTEALAVIVDRREELAGRSRNMIAAAAAAAEKRGLEGKYVIPLARPTSQPSLSRLTNRDVRKRVFDAAVQRGSRGNEYDNKAIVARIAKLRAERAQLRGYDSHADHVLERQTAQTTAAVDALLKRLVPAAVASAQREAADLQQFIDEFGDPELTLEPWDWAFYTEKLRKQRYGFRLSQLRPYLELNRVLEDGVFFMAESLYGVTFRERHDLPTYHPAVRVFEVLDHDGSGLGLVLFDPFRREGKRAGAWMNTYVMQGKLTRTRAVVAVCLNVPQPAEGKPALLTLRRTRTLFHEFGHALHALLSDVRYPTFAGTNVPRDFVEFPSQVHEMWATWPQVLRNYAKHHETGEPVPEEMIEKIHAAAKFNQGFETVQFLAAVMHDKAYHQLPSGDADIGDVEAFEVAALKHAGVWMREIPPRYRSTYFRHIFAGGYSGRYYAYIWSEVLDADAVEWFKANGGLTRENGDRFRRILLSRGGSEDPMQLIRSFLGREPRIEPLLERRGLASP